MTLRAAPATPIEKSLTFLKRVVGTYPAKGIRPLTENEYAKLYETLDSFTDYLPWLDYDPVHNVFEFDDGVNVGALFELEPVDVDGRPPDVLEQLETNVVRALQAIPQELAAPWIVQVYLQDEPIQPKALVAQLREYARADAKDTPHAREWFRALEEHFTLLARKQGLFADPATMGRWGGIQRRVRLCFYRRHLRAAYLNAKGQPIAGTLSPVDELNNAITPFIRMCEQIGMTVRRCDGEAMYRWMVPWLSPKPTGYENAYDYLADRPYPNEDDKPISFDLAAAVTTESPRTATNRAAENNGAFYFCGQAQRFISLHAIDAPPKVGLLTADQRFGKEIKPSLWDQMPPDSIFSLTLVVRSKHDIDAHISTLLRRTGSASYEQDLATEQAHQAQHAMANGQRIYSVSAGVFVRASDDSALQRNTLDAMTVLRAAGLNPTDPNDDPIAKTAFIRALPMVYDFRFDKNHSARSRLTYTNHIARLLPFYGRGRGTGHPGMMAFNRIGEPFMVDPYSKRDRKKTAHGLIFGPPGAGKSAWIVYNKLHAMAMRRPRQFFIEKGRSFSLLALWYKRMGFSVNTLAFTARADISLPPYACMAQALTQIDETSAAPDPASLKTDQYDAHDETYEDDQRDYLGEMELQTQLMITGADPQESDKMTPQDRLSIQVAIITTLRAAHAAGQPHPLISDVCAELDRMTQEDDSEIRKVRLRYMADALRLWTSGMRGHFFNRYGKTWPEVDATFIDMGILTQDQNADMLTVAFVSLINAITGIGEKYQYDGRETEVVTDEGHIITNNPVLVKPFVFGVKTWRKLGIWLDQATQNLEDYPDEARRMLNLAEWWYCLSPPKQEIDDIARFRDITDEEKQLMLTAKKEPGKYAEGVMMSDTLTSLFRIVMPALPLALAQTDQDEKAIRRRIADDHQFTGEFADLDAALKIRDQITAERTEF